MITDPALLKTARVCQKNEITEYRIYTKLAALRADDRNARIPRSVAQDEHTHSLFRKSQAGRKVAPDASKSFGGVSLARARGLTFVLKHIEKNEGAASRERQTLIEAYPEIEKISTDADAREQAPLARLDEESLCYTGSVALGLNGARAELTGALAGFALALGEANMISITGLITGVSAVFSMTDGCPKAATSSLYTGSACFITVVPLIPPFPLVPNKFRARAITLAPAVFIIFLFNCYLSVAKSMSFKKRFAGMAAISLFVAGLPFGAGWPLNRLMGV
ncbi:MAG: rubrerythrin family protein [Treponema sp.]|jgi:VIT1/CCC1 family predicted Fe2+/Mn2+ transporter|nr:rubrerythrin family protein [Treponema sp.]